ncbi:MAG TPA: hypothetical protein VFI71_04935, partial [Pyrinomonadaceae bacterium]|nr:hypothetical protein [Pyrinomonadaceae bacterium]
ESISLEALETLVAMSSMAVELLSVSRGAAAPKRVVDEAPAPAPEPEPSYAPAAEYQAAPEPVAEEPSFSGAETIESYQPEPEPEPVVSESFVEPAPVEEEAAVFESAEESTSSWTTPAPVEAAPEPAPRRRYGQDADLPVEVSGDEERRLHNDARRFARLLISEIKLYNEQKVAEGRSEHDLYDRLREYIDRSREMYDKRVKAEVAARYDYFHGELVNTLAEGDASKLGANYPGATVNA